MRWQRGYNLVLLSDNRYQVHHICGVVWCGVVWCFFGTPVALQAAGLTHKRKYVLVPGTSYRLPWYSLYPVYEHKTLLQYKQYTVGISLVMSCGSSVNTLHHYTNNNSKGAYRGVEGGEEPA